MILPSTPTARSTSTSAPTAPAGQEANWIPTVAGKGFFLVFRFYGPTESYIDKTWVLNDLDLVD